MLGVRSVNVPLDAANGAARPLNELEVPGGDKIDFLQWRGGARECVTNAKEMSEKRNCDG